MRFIAFLLKEIALGRVKKGKELAGIALFRVFLRRTLAGTVGKAVFWQVGLPPPAPSAISSLSGFHLATQTALFLPFQISDSIKNECCGGVGGNISKKGAFLLCRGVPT